MNFFLTALGHKILDKATEQLAGAFFPAVDDTYKRLTVALHAEFDRERLSWLGAGSDLIRYDRSADAMVLLVKAKNSEIHSPVARVLLAAALHKSGNHEGARSELAEALRLRRPLVLELDAPDVSAP